MVKSHKSLVVRTWSPDIQSLYLSLMLCCYFITIILKIWICEHYQESGKYFDYGLLVLP